MTNFREMSVSDIPCVFDVRASTSENAISRSELEQNYGITLESLAEAMRGTLRGWVCEIDSRIVGFAMGDVSTGEVTVLAVLPDYERRGIGRQLLECVQDWLFASRKNELWLLTSPNPSVRAYGFYRSQGWRATGEVDESGDEKLVLRR